MIHLDKEDFKELIKKGNHVVDFYANWCGPCRMMAGVFDALDDKLDIIKVDVDKFNELSEEYKIMSIPTIMFFKDGEKIEEITGFHPEEEILEIADKSFR